MAQATNVVDSIANTGTLSAMTTQIRKIKRRYAHIIGSCIMSLCMTLGMATGVTLVDDGLQDFWSYWLHHFSVGFAINFPLTLLLAPRVRRFISHITE